MSIGRWIVGIVMAGCVWVSPGEATEPTRSVLFREDFDDDLLPQRGWYDGQRFKVSAEAYSGTGCIEYHWKPRTTSPDSSSGVRHLFEPTDTVTDDRWHLVEALFKLNSLDRTHDKPNADGIVRGWFDGKRVVDRSDVVLRSTDFPKMEFNQFLLTPYFGPGLLPQEQRLWIDELVVATERLREE